MEMTCRHLADVRKAVPFPRALPRVLHGIKSTEIKYFQGEDRRLYSNYRASLRAPGTARGCTTVIFGLITGNDQQLTGIRRRNRSKN
jgi:hypothetical protein